MKKVIPFSSPPDGRAPLVAAQPAPSSTDAAAVTARQGWDQAPEQQLLLLQRLIGCGERGELIQRFVRWATELNLAEGVSYRAERGDDDIALGNRRHHSAIYELELDQRPLGSVQLFRRERYSEDELLAIEQGLGALTRCLRLADDVLALRSLATRDPLTGLRNRTALDEWLSKETARSQRHGHPLALMMIDVDHFKVINDRLGHATGDAVLRALAQIFTESTRRSDLSFRFGGDEFAILLPHTEIDNAAIVAEQIRHNLKRRDDTAPGLPETVHEMNPDISVGIAAFREGDDCDGLLRRADTHLYHAKAMGRGRVCSSL